MNPLQVVLIVLGVFVALFLLGRAVGMRLRGQSHVVVTDLRAVCLELTPRIADYMQANYGGNPVRLDEAMRGLVPIAHEVAHRHGHKLDADTMRVLLSVLVSAQGVASRAEVEAALDRIVEEPARAVA